MNKIKQRSTYKCNICHEALCITSCFEIFHTRSKLPNNRTPKKFLKSEFRDEKEEIKK